MLFEELVHAIYSSQGLLMSWMLPTDLILLNLQ